ncbi:MAG: hypothetical protein NWS74_12360 [Salibacteraceae bacterium]|jgi:hypothetical protein|nr:hypothetical protein [Salibacteraceae bacterium]MDP4764621.1 hypothetical protein [Salibacteraceae bacterium]
MNIHASFNDRVQPSIQLVLATISQLNYYVCYMLDEQPEHSFQLYSKRSILGATFLGGPLAAGILMHINFKNAGEQELANRSLLIGIVTSFLLILLLLILPENVLDAMPNSVFPLVYTGIVYLLLDRYQGDMLKAHESQFKPFYSWIKAALIALLSAVLFLGGAVAAAMLPSANVTDIAYDKGIVQFSENESEALRVFDMMDTESGSDIIQFIQRKGIPLWMANIEILNDLDQLDDLDSELIDQNKLLREYCQLRVKSYHALSESLKDSTPENFARFEALSEQIEVILGKL